MPLVIHKQRTFSLVFKMSWISAFEDARLLWLNICICVCAVLVDTISPSVLSFSLSLSSFLSISIQFTSLSFNWFSSKFWFSWVTRKVTHTQTQILCVRDPQEGSSFIRSLLLHQCFATFFHGRPVHFQHEELFIPLIFQSVSQNPKN